MHPGTGADDVLYAPASELTDTSYVVPSELRSRPNPRRRKRRLEEFSEAIDLYGGHESLLVRTAIIRAEGYDPRKAPEVGNFDAACALLDHLAYADQEHLITIALDAKNRVRAIHEAAIGGTFGLGQQPRHILKIAFLTGSPSVIVAHNHPSGDPVPSVEDVRMTRELLKAAAVVGLYVLDHVVVARDGCRSLRDVMSFEVEPD